MATVHINTSYVRVRFIQFTKLTVVSFFIRFFALCDV